jgi:hypothetical protein
MADYSDAEARDAQRIVERCMEAGEGPPEVEEALAISDVEGDAADFVAELEVLSYIGASVPAVLVGGEELVPVALSLLGGPAFFPYPVTAAIANRTWRRHPFFVEWADYVLRSLTDEENHYRGFETLSLDRARETFVRRATEFLATRIASVRELRRRQSSRWTGLSFLNLLQRAGGPRVSTPGCNFTVSTQSGGLRVFWSGAYRVSPNYFSHPTTPAQGVLQSGTYVFGVDGGAYGNQIQWDLNAVVSLPGSPSTHLNF